jgi:hypothetical protein
MKDSYQKGNLGRNAMLFNYELLNLQFFAPTNKYTGLL